MSMTDAEKRVIDGTTWDQFCDALKDAGKIIRSDKAPQDAFNQAEGYRYLTRLLRGGLESSLENRVVIQSCASPDFRSLKSMAWKTPRTRLNHYPVR
jgi:hypothetical protein